MQDELTLLITHAFLLAFGDISKVVAVAAASAVREFDALVGGVVVPVTIKVVGALASVLRVVAHVALEGWNDERCVLGAVLK